MKRVNHRPTPKAINDLVGNLIESEEVHRVITNLFE